MAAEVDHDALARSLVEAAATRAPPYSRSGRGPKDVAEVDAWAASVRPGAWRVEPWHKTEELGIPPAVAASKRNDLPTLQRLVVEYQEECEAVAAERDARGSSDDGSPLNLPPNPLSLTDQALDSDALQWAAKYGFFGVVVFCVSKGADVFRTNLSGNTAEMLARQACPVAPDDDDASSSLAPPPPAEVMVTAALGDVDEPSQPTGPPQQQEDDDAPAPENTHRKSADLLERIMHAGGVKVWKTKVTALLNARAKGAGGWIEVYHRCDANANDVIEPDEFVAIVRSDEGLRLGPDEVVDAEIDVIFSAVDINCDGDVTLRELMAFIKPRKPKRQL